MNGSLLIAFPRPTGAFPCFAFRSRIARRLPLAPAINHAKPEHTAIQEDRPLSTVAAFAVVLALVVAAE